MALAEVSVTEEVWLSCITHALSTESEEIMGILFGDVVYPGHAHSEPYARKSPAPSQDPCTPEKTPIQRMAAGPWPGAPSVLGPHSQAGADAGAGAAGEGGEGAGGVAHIWCAMPQLRADRRKDRVETTPEQLMEAALYAEHLGHQVGTTTRAIGWYHSHPHITVHPSHVDVRTQAMYQTLDVGFVGLIFACFDNDAATETGRVQAVAFQSIPRHQAAAQRTGGGASVAAGSPIGGSFPGWQESQSPGGGRESLDGANDLARDDSLRLREALRLSQLETQSGDFVAREIPIRVLPSPRFLYPPFLSSLQFLTPPGGAHTTNRDTPPGLRKGEQHSGRGSFHEHASAHSTASPQTQSQTGVGMRPLGLDSFGGALDPLRALPAILFQEEQAQFHLATPGMIASTSRSDEPLTPSRQFSSQQAPVTSQEGQVPSLQASQRQSRPRPLAVLQNCSAYQGALCQLLDTCLLPLLQQALDQGKQARAGARGRGKGGVPLVLLEEYLSPPPPPGAGGTPSAGSTRPAGTPSGSCAAPGGTPSGGGTPPTGRAPPGGTASAGGGGDSLHSLSSLGRALEGDGFPGLEASGAPFGLDAQGRLDQMPAATGPPAASAAEGSWYAMASGVEHGPDEPSTSRQQQQQQQDQQQRPLPSNTRPEVGPEGGHMQGQGTSQEHGQQEFWQRQGQGPGQEQGQGNGEEGSCKAQWWGGGGARSSRGTSEHYSDMAHAGATYSDTSTVNTGGFSHMGSTLSSSAASSSASPGSAFGTPTPYSPRLQAPSFLAGADTPSAAHGPGYTAGGPTHKQGTGQVGNAHMHTVGASEFSGSGGGTSNQRAGREGPGQGLGFGSELGLAHTAGGALYETSAHGVPMFMPGSNPFVDSGAAGPVDSLPGVYPGIPPLPYSANNNNSPAFMSSISDFMPGRAAAETGPEEGAWEDNKGGSGPKSRHSEGNRQRSAGLGHAAGVPGADEGGPEDKKGNWLRNIKNAVKAPRQPGARSSGGFGGWSGEGEGGRKGGGGLLTALPGKGGKGSDKRM